MINYMEILLDSGITVFVKQIPNILIFEYLSSLKIPVPQPPVVELDDGRETENTFSPVYQDAITIYQLQMNNLAFDAILEHAIEFDKRLLQNKHWVEKKRYLRNQFFYNREVKEEVSFLRYFALGESWIDKLRLTQNAILHELAVLDIFNSLIVTRDGYDIKEANIKNSIKTGVETHPVIIEGCQLVNPLDELKACKELGLDWIKWYRCEYSLREKATTIGLYRLNRLMESHQEDAVQIESEKRSKKK